MSGNNPAVDLATRRFLWQLVADGVLDAPCARLLQRALEKTVRVQPGGLVLLLADALGAKPDSAFAAASFAELFYAMASLTDDLQDGDAAKLFPDLQPALHVNVLAQLMCVAVVRGAELSQHQGAERASHELARAFRIGAEMLCGQRIELLREDWNVERWRAVAERSAGRQFELYLRLAAAAAGRDCEELAALGMPLGVLTQLKQDRVDADPRLLALPGDEVERLESEALGELRAAVARIDGRLVEVLRPQLEWVGAVAEA